MNSDIIISFIARDKQGSTYDWANITVGNERVGKARCHLKERQMIIYSINIFPEFEGNGYGKAFVEKAKMKYDTVVADRVRATAIGFWEKMGFVFDKDSNWIYRK